MRRVGPYEIQEEIARGGAGAVYRAWDPAAEREVAIKLLHTGASNQSALKRFEREGRALARLEHPHVVQVHTVGKTHDGQPYLVMALVEGRSLQDVLDREGPVEVGRAAEWVAKVARAVEHAHTHGVLHRDLKPSNVLLDPRGEPLLTDFGLALDLSPDSSRVTTDGMFMGTIGYMSPEQAEGRLNQIGPPADVFGLGALLFALLTREAPFPAERLVSGLNRLRSPATPLTDLRPEARALEPITRRCLALASEDRFPSAAALADALEQFLDTSQDPAPQRSRGISALALALASAGLVGGGAILFRSPPQRAEAPPPTSSPPTSSGIGWAPILEDLRGLARRRHWRTLMKRSNELTIRSLSPRGQEDLAAAALAHEAWASTMFADYTRAIARADAALVLDRKQDLALLARGSARLAQGDPAKAREDLARLEALGERGPAEELRLRIWLSEGSDEESTAALRELATRRGDPDLLILLALRLNGVNARREALGALDQAHEAAPDYYRPLLAKASLLNAYEVSPEEVIAQLHAALELAGDEPGRCLEFLARIQTKLGRHGDASETYERLVVIWPRRPKLWAKLGQALENHLRLREALHSYERAVELDPTRPQPRADHQRVLLRLGEYEAALAEGEALLQMAAPGQLEWHVPAALARLATRDWEGVQELYEQAQRDGSDDGTFASLAAMSALLLGDATGAEAYAKSVPPGGVPANMGTAVLAQLELQRGSAGSACDRLLRLELPDLPPSKWIRSVRAQVYLRHGQPSRALDELEAALEGTLPWRGFAEDVQPLLEQARAQQAGD